MDPYIYQYAGGGIVFAIGLFYAAKQGYIGFSGRKLRSLLVLLGGLAFFAGLQGWLQYADMAERTPCEYPCEEARAGHSPEQIAKADELAGKVLNKRKAKDLKKRLENGELGEEAYNAAISQIPKPGKMGSNLDYGIMVAYFLAMLGIGTWFGRGQTSTKDFFFGGQRFSWWLISFSLVATTIGSYSFVKYSKIAYTWGIASSQTYLNDWFWIPLLLFGWLPILYFSRVVSIPEYFERRFGRPARNASTVLLLIYLVGYVGINLFTMGQALNILLGWDVFLAAAGVAAISATYVTFGGQTSVIMTDLFQGVMLLATGMVILVLGASYLGGFGDFWENLPRSHRLPFPSYSEDLGIYGDASYPAVGIFWQDAIANSAMFYFLNQGMVMRLMAARSIKDSRKAMVTMLLVLMPIAALVVASGGWAGKALSNAGVLPALDAKDAFFVASELLAMPGMFGLVMAALTAALMSTVDTLITAIAAIMVNDVYRPFKERSGETAVESDLLKVARISSVSIAVLGVLLVPVFQSFKSIYAAHGAFTAAVTPPLVVSLLLGVFWRRFNLTAAMCTMIGGSVVIFASILYPELITPFAQGVPMREVGDEFLAGKNQYKFMRGLFGMTCCMAIGIAATLATKGRPLDELRGLVWGTISDAIRSYKGSDGTEDESGWAYVKAEKGGPEEVSGHAMLPLVRISQALADELQAGPDALLYVSDARAWLGGLRSTHAQVEAVDAALQGRSIAMGSAMHGKLSAGRENHDLRVKRLY
jgi:solute:Na+ symporter, SSS family